MRIQYISDLHLEFQPIDIENNNADLLILAGDITTTKAFKDSLSFFQRCADRFSKVIYIAGNHEFYHGDIEQFHGLALQALYPLKNVHYLDNEGMKISDDLDLWGGTLWTDCNQRDPITESVLQSSMNDYRLIKWKSRERRKLRPPDTVDLHNNALLSLFKRLRDGKRTIVVSHHGPSFKSIHPKYYNDIHMNSGFVSDLAWLEEDCKYDIPLWFHGHVHNTFNYKVGNTNVLTNPRGYATLGRDGKLYNENEEFDPNKVVEI